MSSETLDLEARVTAHPSAKAPSLADRIDVVDVLRGIALLGMFVVHFTDNIASPPATDLEHGIQRFSHLFLSDRFHTMFAILFGASFAIQLRRADAEGRSFGARYLRRLGALAAFGVIAELVFGFQILFGYAIWGLVLLPIRRLPTSLLLVLALACGAARPLYAVARAAYYTPAISAQQLVSNDQAVQAASDARFRAMGAGLRSTDWRRVFGARLARMKNYYATPILPPSDLFYFLLGLIALREGLLDHARARRGWLVGLTMFGVASWALVTWVFPTIRPLPLPAAGVSYAPTVFLNSAARGFGLIRSQWLTFGYMGAVLLLAPDGARTARYLAPFAWTGRMALTNYMVQIAVIATLFSPLALGLHVSLTFAPACGIALFALQALFSRWWLNRHRYGPLEWIWRSVSYWKVETNPRSLAEPRTLHSGSVT
jgi:uncharacterized protein